MAAIRDRIAAEIGRHGGELDVLPLISELSGGLQSGNTRGASADELAAHESSLDSIARASGDNVVWRAEPNADSP